VSCPEDFTTLLERAIILKSKLQDFTPIVNYVVKGGNEDRYIHSHSLFKMMENISMPHAIIMMVCGAHFDRSESLWITLMNLVVKLTSKYQLERNTTHVRGLNHLAMESYVKTILGSKKTLTTAFSLVPEQLQSLFCYHVCLSLLVQARAPGVVRLIVRTFSDKQDYFALTRCISELADDITGCFDYSSVLTYAFCQGPDVIRRLFQKVTTMSDTVMTLYTLLCETNGYVTESFDFLLKLGKCLTERSEASKRLFNLIDKLDKNEMMPKLQKAQFSEHYTYYLVKSKLISIPLFRKTICIPKLIEILDKWSRNLVGRNNYKNEVDPGSHIFYCETIPDLIWDLKVSLGEDNEQSLIELCDHFLVSDTLAQFATIAVDSNWTATASMLVLCASSSTGRLKKIDLFTKFSSILKKDQKVILLAEITKQSPTPDNYRQLIALDPSWKDRMDEIITVGSTITTEAIPLLMEFKKYSLIATNFLSFSSPYLPKLCTILYEALKANMKDDDILTNFEITMNNCIEMDYGASGGRRVFYGYDDTVHSIQVAGYPTGIPRELNAQSAFGKLIEDLFAKKATKTALKLLELFTSNVQVLVSSSRTRSYGEYVTWVLFLRDYMDKLNYSGIFKEWVSTWAIYGRNIRNKPKLVKMLDMNLK
jgi:hypothetical protein